MEGKHTPGPWKIDEGNFIVTTKDNLIVAEVPCQGANDNDLFLIAAAPDLLEACKRGHQRLLEMGQRESHRTVSILQAAIAQAEKRNKKNDRI